MIALSKDVMKMVGLVVKVTLLDQCLGDKDRKSDGLPLPFEIVAIRDFFEIFMNIFT